VYFLVFTPVKFRVKRKLKGKRKNLLNILYKELENNKNKLEISFKYHQSIKAEIDSIGKVLNESDFFTTYIGNKKFRHDRIKGWNGVKNANLDDMAFEAAKISGIIKEFDFEIIQNISEIYKFQKEYSEFGNSILKKMINFNSSTKVADVFGSIDLITSDLKNYEKSLIEAIKKAQSVLTKPQNNGFK